MTMKGLSCRETKWWKKLSGLYLLIKYCLEKKNPADRLFYHPDYVFNSNNPMHIMKYVLQSSNKAWKNEEVWQALQDSKITSESESNLESLSVNNNNPLSITYHGANNKLDAEEVRVPLKSQPSKSIAKWALENALPKLLFEALVKPIRLCFMNNNNLETQVKQEDIKFLKKN